MNFVHDEKFENDVFKKLVKVLNLLKAVMNLVHHLFLEMK